jgi:putative hydroxymethylpyrimidine transport system ATP-binding protein
MENVGKSYNQNEVIRDISLHVDQGEFVSVLGPSGCGKTTVFNIIAGLLEADRGELEVQGALGYMQQKDLLLPWKTVLDNIILPLILKGKPKQEARKQADAYLDLMGLRGYEHEYPYQLSGGMKQRANFLRTFMASQETMLLDEPFGALDSITKGKMQRWLLEIKTRLNLSILFITHDIEEAIFLSDRIYVISSKPGRIVKELEVSFFKEDKQERLVSEKLLKLKEEILTLL